MNRIILGIPSWTFVYVIFIFIANVIGFSTVRAWTVGVEPVAENNGESMLDALLSNADDLILMDGEKAVALQEKRSSGLSNGAKNEEEGEIHF